MHALAATIDLRFLRNSLVAFLMVALIVGTCFTYLLVPKPVEALFGIADFNFTTIVADIPGLALKILKGFILGMLNNLLKKAVDWVKTKISNNFIIKNYLRYQATIRDRRYLFDYLTSYIPNAESRGLVVRAINDFNRGGFRVSKDTSNRLVERSDDYRGYKMEDIQPDDPEYLGKMLINYDPYTSPYGQYYGIADQALKARAESDKAATLNLSTPGFKTSYETGSGMAVTSSGQVAGITVGQADGLPSCPAGQQYSITLDKCVAQDGSGDSCGTGEVFQIGKGCVPDPGGSSVDWGSWGSNVSTGVRNPLNEIDALYVKASQVLFEKLNAGADGLTSAIGNAIANFAFGAIQNALRGGTVYDEYKDFQAQITSPLGASPIEDPTVTDLIYGDSSSPIDNVNVPAFCKASTYGSAQTDLGKADALGGSGGSASATLDSSGSGDGGIGGGTSVGTTSGGGNTGDSGGTADAQGGQGGDTEIDLNNGRMRSSPETAGCGNNAFTETDANQLIRQLDTTNGNTGTYGDNPIGPGPEGTGGDMVWPSRPASFRVTAVTDGSVTLAWSPSTDNSGVVTKYYITAKHPNGSEDTRNTNGATTFTFGGLEPNIEYTFLLMAQDGSGNMSQVAELNVTTTGSGSVLSAPTNLSVNRPSRFEYTLRWTPSSNLTNITGYVIYQDNVEIARVSGASTSSYAGTFSHAYPENQTIGWRVRAYGPNGQFSIYSNFATIIFGS